MKERINQNFRTPFATHSAMRNNHFNTNYPLNKLQYEDADKFKNKRLHMKPKPNLDK